MKAYVASEDAKIIRIATAPSRKPMGLALLGASLPMLLGTSLGILARVPWSADRPSWSNESSDVEPVWPRQKTDERLGIDSGWIQMVIFPQEFVLLVSCPRLFGQDFHRHTNRDMLVSLNLSMRTCEFQVQKGRIQ